MILTKSYGITSQSFICSWIRVLKLNEKVWLSSNSIYFCKLGRHFLLLNSNRKGVPEDQDLSGEYKMFDCWKKSE